MVERLIELFKKEYGRYPPLIVRAPGRINLIGEHTDYNLGLVFPAAIDKSMYFAFAENDSDRYNITACDKQSTISLSASKLHCDNLWGKYCVGVIHEFIKLGISPKGFDCTFLSEIPIGSGLSSSAALECGLAKGIDTLNNSKLDSWQLARIGNQAENIHLGVQSGILDQFSSLFGRKNEAMLMDCSNHQFEYLPVDIEPYNLVLINTNVKHSNLSSGYNDRPSECAEVVMIAKANGEDITSLSQLTPDQLIALKPKLSETLYNRALFILNENNRVKAFKSALINKDFYKLGELLYKSHEGLQHQFEVSCKELDYLITLSRTQASILGARMMGGGFGGCTLNLIHGDQMEKVINEMCASYYDHIGIEATPYYVSIGDGVEIINR